MIGNELDTQTAEYADALGAALAADSEYQRLRLLIPTTPRAELPALEAELTRRLDTIRAQLAGAKLSAVVQ